MSKTNWEDDHHCFACGSQNPVGLHLQFTLDGEGGLRSEYTPDARYQGYAGIVHGGFIGLLLDEVIANLPWRKEHQGVVTAEILLKLHRPAKINEKLLLRAFYAKPNRGRLVEIQGEARDTQNQLIASASAKCVKVKIG
jgi:acyl-coenzyme A thioesterase PaaI-like protein